MFLFFIKNFGASPLVAAGGVSGGRGRRRARGGGRRGALRHTTQAAAEQVADARMRGQRVEIEHLQTQLRAVAGNQKDIQAKLTSAQEKYVSELAARDRAYSQEIAVFLQGCRGYFLDSRWSGSLGAFQLRR